MLAESARDCQHGVCIVSYEGGACGKCSRMHYPRTTRCTQGPCTHHPRTTHCSRAVLTIPRGHHSTWMVHSHKFLVTFHFLINVESHSSTHRCPAGRKISATLALLLCSVRKGPPLLISLTVFKEIISFYIHWQKKCFSSGLLDGCNRMHQWQQCNIMCG